MGKELLSKTMHITTLDKHQQMEVLDKVSEELGKLGIEDGDYSDAMQNAQDGRLCDLEELIDLGSFKTFQVK